MTKRVDKRLIAEACLAIKEATGFEAGAEIKTARISAALGLPEFPERQERESDEAFIRRFRRHEMARIPLMEALRERLLTVHKIDLQATGHGAYRVIPPGEQAKRAERDGLRAAKKALRASQARIMHVDEDRRAVGIGPKRTIRTRPKFNDWRLRVTFEHEEEVISERDLLASLEQAGRYCGIGEYRPSSPKGGQFGRFSIETVNGKSVAAA